MTPAAVVGLVVAAAGAAAMLGARVERWRHRRVEPCERDRWDTERTELVDRNIELRQALQQYQRELSTRLQRAYDAGQGAMLERLTGLHAAERFKPVAPEKWVGLQEARENWEAN